MKGVSGCLTRCHHKMFQCQQTKNKGESHGGFHVVHRSRETGHSSGTDNNMEQVLLMI